MHRCAQAALGKGFNPCLAVGSAGRAVVLPARSWDGPTGAASRCKSSAWVHQCGFRCTLTGAVFGQLCPCCEEEGAPLELPPAPQEGAVKGCA